MYVFINHQFYLGWHVVPIAQHSLISIENHWDIMTFTILIPESSTDHLPFCPDPWPSQVPRTFPATAWWTSPSSARRRISWWRCWRPWLRRRPWRCWAAAAWRCPWQCWRRAMPGGCTWWNCTGWCRGESKRRSSGLGPTFHHSDQVFFPGEMVGFGTFGDGKWTVSRWFMMIYRLKMGIFHGYRFKNQRVVNGGSGAVKRAIRYSCCRKKKCKKIKDRITPQVNFVQ